MFLRILAVLFSSATILLASDSAMRPEVARLLPPDAVTVGGFELQALRGTPLFDRLASRFPVYDNGLFDRVLSAAGFDPRRDIDRVLTASDRAPSEASEASLVILEGRLDVEGEAKGLLALFRKTGEHAGVALYRPLDGAAAHEVETVAFLDARTALAGPAARVQAAIDRWRAPAEEASRPARAALAQNGAHAWAVMLDPRNLIGDYLEHIPGGGGPLQAIFQSVETLSLRATAASNAVRGQMAFLCGGPDDARSLADAAQTVAAFGALTAQRTRPELADLLGRLEVGHDGNETTVSVELTEWQLLELRNSALKAAGVSLR